jgi:hypothetical protein
VKPRHIVLGAALLVAAGFALFGDKRPDGAVVEPAPRNAAAAPAPALRAAAPAAKPAGAHAILRLEPRDTLIGDGADAPGADAFGSRNWTPPPPPPPAPPPAPPPSAPPLPFTYIGKAVANGQWEVFLARGSETLIVRAKMTIDGAWRVDTIAPPSITFTYLPLNQVQQLNIGVLD